MVRLKESFVLIFFIDHIEAYSIELQLTLSRIFLFLRMRPLEKWSLIKVINWSLQNENYPYAGEKIEALISKYPLSEVGMLEWANLAELQGEEIEALSRWENASLQFPNSINVKLGKARVLEKVGRPMEALLTIRPVYIEHPENVRLTIYLAQLLRKQSYTAEALRLVVKLRDLKPRNTELFNEHTKLLVESGFTEGFKAVCRAFIESNEKNFAGYNQLVRLAKRENNHIEFLDVLQQMKKHFPNRVKMKLVEIQYFNLIDNIQESNRLIKIALKRFPSEIRLQKAKIRNFLLTNQPEEAIEILKRLIKKFPKNAELHFLQSHCYVQLGDFNSARLLLSALAAQPHIANEPQFYKNCSRVFEGASQKEIHSLVAAIPISNNEILLRYLTELEKQELFKVGLCLLDRVRQNTGQHNLLENDIALMQCRLKMKLLLSNGTSKQEIVNQSRSLLMELANSLGIGKFNVPDQVNAYIDPLGALEQTQRIIDAIVDQKPFSLIRFDAKEEDFLPNITNSNGQNTLILETIEQSLMLADIVAIESIRPMNSDSSGKGYSDLSNHSDKKIMGVKTLATMGSICELEMWGLYDYIFSFIGECHVISPITNIKQLLQERFETEVISTYAIPIPDAWQVEDQHESASNREQLKLASQLQTEDLKGKIFLIDAGRWGRLFATIIKKKGGIALDMGGQLSQWHLTSHEDRKDEPMFLSYFKHLVTDTQAWELIDNVLLTESESNNVLNPVHYWINLAGALNRKRDMELLFSENNLSNIRVEANTPLTMPTVIEPPNFRLKQLEYACLSSHFKAIKEGANSGEYFIVQEDDLRIIHPVNLGQLIATAPDDWEILQLHAANPSVIRKLFESFKAGELWMPWQNKSVSAMIYAVNGTWANKFLHQRFDEEKNQIDLSKVNYPPVPDRLFYTEATTYTLTLPIFNAASLDSQMHPDHLRFHRLSLQTSEVVRMLIHAKNPRLSQWIGR